MIRNFKALLIFFCIAIENSSSRYACLLWSGKFDAKVFEISDDCLSSKALFDVEVQWIGQHQRITLEIKSGSDAVFGKG